MSTNAELLDYFSQNFQSFKARWFFKLRAKGILIWLLITFFFSSSLSEFQPKSKLISHGKIDVDKADL